MEIKKLKLSQIKPYEKNPRKNDQAVDAVVASIEQCGYCSPILVDENNVILAGHTRYKALQKLGWKEAEVVIRDGLTDEQKRKYRLLDNKTNEFASWDFDLLADEIEGLDFGGFDFGFGDIGTSGEEASVPDAQVDSAFNYKEQYAVEVMCKDENDQIAVYERLTGEGYECKVVCV